MGSVYCCMCKVQGGGPGGSVGEHAPEVMIAEHRYKVLQTQLYAICEFFSLHPPATNWEIQEKMTYFSHQTTIIIRL